jgi:hypothetical protein
LELGTPTTGYPGIGAGAIGRTLVKGLSGALPGCPVFEMGVGEGIEEVERALLRVGAMFWVDVG